MPQPLDISPSMVFAAELAPLLLDGFPAYDSVPFATAIR
jgi:hypothetical protein